jgi:transketolase
VRDHFIKTLAKLVEANPRILLLSGDLGFGSFNEFRKKFSANFINAGVAEQNMIGLATGLALEDRIVFTYSIANFSTLRCLEQIRNDAAYHNANVKIVAVGGGLSYGPLGISHHTTEDIAVMKSLPGVTVLSPCGFWETVEATKAVAKQPGTCYLRLDKSIGEDTPINEEVFRIGKGRLLREGNDCTIFVTGGILGEVLLAADRLFAKGIRARVVSIHTIKPIDEETILNSVKETGIIAAVEEHTTIGGMSSSIAECIMDKGTYPKQFLRIGLEGYFSSNVGSQAYLRKCYGLDAKSIANRIYSVFV